MHWVKATTPDDRDIHINLAAIQHTMRVDGVTIAFLGGVAYNSDGRVQYATTSVKETLEELLARPKLEPGVNVPPSAYTAAAKGIASRTATETVSEIARKAMPEGTRPEKMRNAPTGLTKQQSTALSRASDAIRKELAPLAVYKQFEDVSPFVVTRFKQPKTKGGRK